MEIPLGIFKSLAVQGFSHLGFIIALYTIMLCINLEDANKIYWNVGETIFLIYFDWSSLNSVIYYL